jgi:hypothetical protein
MIYLSIQPSEPIGGQELVGAEANSDEYMDRGTQTHTPRSGEARKDYPRKAPLAVKHALPRTFGAGCGGCCTVLSVYTLGQAYGLCHR